MQDNRDRECLKQPGRYVLLIEVQQSSAIQTRAKAFSFAPGWYAYVGSAAGPGGLHSRLARHYSHQKRKHWHLDYLLAEAELQGHVAFTSETGECELAQLTHLIPRTKAVIGFGASDCSCRSHLLRLPGPFQPEALAQELLLVAQRQDSLLAPVDIYYKDDARL